MNGGGAAAPYLGVILTKESDSPVPAVGAVAPYLGVILTNNPQVVDYATGAVAPYLGVILTNTGLLVKDLDGGAVRRNPHQHI